MGGGEGLAGGELTWAVGPDPALQISFSDLSLSSCLHACPFCSYPSAQVVALGGADAELTRMWKPKVHSIPNFLVNGGGGSLSAPREQAGWLPHKHQPLLLISRNFNDLSVFKLCHLSR